MGEGHNAASEPWSYAYLRLKKGGVVLIFSFNV